MSEEEQDDDGRVDYGEVVGRSFLDKLLLAIIDAHTEERTTLSAAAAGNARVKRLAEAKQALFGETPREGRPLISDEAVLRWMGEEHYKDRARQGLATLKREPRPKARSDRQLANQAVRKFKLPDNAVERLRGKFGPQRQKWLDIAMQHDDVSEQLDAGLLTAVQENFAKRGLPMNLDRIER